MKIYPDRPGGGDRAPLVSVIIPTYNRFELLRQAVGSVLSQTFLDYELIVVDDGSRDATARIGADGIEADIDALLSAAEAGGLGGLRGEELPRMRSPRRFRYVSIPHTGMPGAVRNSGVKEAQGRYLAFIDSDDLWMPRKLERQVAAMTGAGRCRISHTREVWLRKSRVISQSGQRHQREGRLFLDSLVKCIIGPSTVMMERSLYEETGGFRDDLEIGEDYELWLRITPGCDVTYVDMPLTIKRAGHGDQLTGKYGHIEFFRIQALKDLLDRGFFQGPDCKTASSELARKCRVYAAGAKKRGRIEEAERYEEIASGYAPKP